MYALTVAAFAAWLAFGILRAAGCVQQHLPGFVRLHPRDEMPARIGQKESLKGAYGLAQIEITVCASMQPPSADTSIGSASSVTGSLSMPSRQVMPSDVWSILAPCAPGGDATAIATAKPTDM
jgi:hypothetical protein